LQSAVGDGVEDVVAVDEKANEALKANPKSAAWEGRLSGKNKKPCMRSGCPKAYTA